MRRRKMTSIKRVISSVLSLSLVMSMSSITRPQKVMAQAINRDSDTVQATYEVQTTQANAATQLQLSNPVIVTDSSMEAGQKVTWDCVYFGSYPQSEVVASEADETSVTSNISNGKDYIVDATTYNQLKNATGWDSNGDIVLANGDKYRRVSESDATYSTTSTGYYQWKTSGGYSYFKYEPIKWRVLSSDGKEALLLADMALDDRRYNESYTSITWEKSTIRSFLNSYGSSYNTYGNSYTSSGFLTNAFTEEERTQIISGSVINSDNKSSGTTGGNATTDKIFLLSEDEVYGTGASSYGFVSLNSAYDEARRAKSSTYAKAMGCKSGDSPSYAENCYWWLRSPGNFDENAAYVSGSGWVGGSGNFVSSGAVGIRPALKLNLSSSNPTYAGTVSSDGTVIEPTIQLPLSNPVIVTDSSMESGQKVTWDCVYFGSYPQSEVVASEADETSVTSNISNGKDYIVDATTYNQLKNATGWDSNGDIVLANGDKYRRVSESDATYSTTSTGFYQWKTSGGYSYFKYEPIKWRVLSSDGKEALLLADMALDDRRYNESATSITWEKSTIRSFLNSYGSSYNTYGNIYTSSGFLTNAFTEEERTQIISGSVINSDNKSSGTTGGNATTDKIFLLSEDEVYGTGASSYGFVSFNSAYEAKRAKSSTYAKAMGCYSSSNDAGNCNWWLRSPGYFGRIAANVDGSGWIDFYVNQDTVAVRPALKLNLSSSNPTYAGTVSSDGTAEPYYIVSLYENNNETDYSEDCYKSFLVKQGVEIGELPILKRDGYNFLGWYTSKSDGTKILENDTATSNMRLYAHWEKEKMEYEIYFDDGNSLSLIKVDKGKNIETFPIPTKEGFDFIGWYTSQDYETQVDENYIVNSDITLYAKWKSQYNKVYFNVNDVTLYTKDVISGESIGELPLVENGKINPRRGYVLNGWYTSESFDTKVYSSFVPTSDTTLYGKWNELDSYVIYFDANGGTVSKRNINVYKGEQIGTLPTPIREGYTFVGWYTDGTDGILITNTYIPTSNKTVYAKWINQYNKVYFNINDVTVYKQNVISGESIGELPSIENEKISPRQGYVFEGWYTSESFSKKVYSSFVPTSDTTLFGKWRELDSYIISFDANGGTVSKRNINVYEGEMIGTLPTPVRQGYIFEGWYDSSSSGNIITQYYEPTTDATFYAHWKREYYKAYFISDGITTNIEVKCGESIGELQIPEKEGYVFDGWYTSEDYTHKIESSYVLEGDQTFYAKWSEGDVFTYYVWFAVDGGEDVEDVLIYAQGETLGDLPTTSKKGYTFRGWYDDENEGEKVSRSTIVDHDMMLVAHWSLNTYKLIYNANGGKVSQASQNVKYDGVYGKLPIPTKSGYSFKGWYTSKTGGSKVTANTRMGDANKTIYARWALNAPGTTKVTVKLLSSNSLKLTWNKVARAKGYNIYRSTSLNGTYTKIKTVGENVTSFNNTGLKDGVTYYYKIVAYAKDSTQTVNGKSSVVVSKKVIGKVGTTTLKIGQDSKDKKKLFLSWGNIKNAKKIVIYRSINKKNASRWQTIDANKNTFSFTVKNLAKGRYDYYIVGYYSQDGINIVGTASNQKGFRIG